MSKDGNGHSGYVWIRSRSSPKCKEKILGRKNRKKKGQKWYWISVLGLW